MNPPLHHHDHTAAFGGARAGACSGARGGAADPVWLDAGIALRRIGVDSHRPAAGHPAIVAGAARGLLRQFGAAH